ncbi:MAG: hypothetical protein M3527_10305, partial [Actinomycetota bacterium]|nr:hypothetical protein [Actinomycetota bacterium]
AAASGLGPSSAAFPEDNCGMIPVADISEAAGLEFTIEEEDPFAVPGCRYAAPDSGVLYLTYRFDDFSYRQALQDADESAIIDGIGAGAFESFPPNARAVEVLLDDGRSFQVQAGAGADDPEGLQRIAAFLADTLPGLHG